MEKDHSVQKRLKLFGFELNPLSEHNINEDSVKDSAEADHESVNSSNSVSSAERSATDAEEKKLLCQYCFKEFTNSQALGGHQNAHKKERMKKRKLQLQANKECINYYLSQQNHGSNNCWFYDPSSYNNNNSDELFTFYDESQISFNSSCDLQDGFDQKSKWYVPYSKQDTCMFSFSHIASSDQGHVNKTHEDLQLGLSLKAHTRSFLWSM